MKINYSKELFILAIIVVCFYVNSFSQSIKDYVEKNAVLIKTIDVNDSDNFADLETIGNSIGDARIVMLGEQDHGDAPTFLAKTRLIKYLHEKKGFDVLAFESDFFALNYAWDKLEKNTTSIDSFLFRNIFPVWTVCDGCKNLFYNYLPSTFNTKNPLQISGFDNQMILDYSWKNLNRIIDSFFKAKKFPVVETGNYKRFLVQLDILKRFPYLKDSAKKELIPMLDSAKDQFKIIQQQANNLLVKDDFWMVVINSYLANLTELQADGFVEGNTVRDAQMAKNLEWLCNVKYPNKKIIIWAASAHIQKQWQENRNQFDFPSMGSIFTSDSSLKKQTYVLGFASATGTAGRLTLNNTFKVARPLDNSFETWINKNYDYAFVDFTNFNQQYPHFDNPFNMKGTRHYYAKRVWNNVFNGIFFIRNMYPCKNILKEK